MVPLTATQIAFSNKKNAWFSKILKNSKNSKYYKEQQRLLLKELELRIWIFPFDLATTFLEVKNYHQ